MLDTQDPKWQTNESIMFTYNQWIGIHGALCTAFVFADSKEEKETLREIMFDIENFLIRDGIIERKELISIYELLASKRETRKLKKWLLKKR